MIWKELKETAIHTWYSCADRKNETQGTKAMMERSASSRDLEEQALAVQLSELCRFSFVSPYA
jgi:hypothetical protein